MSTTPGSVYEWQDLPWRSLEQQVFKLQKRIYRAAQWKDSHTVHRLQRLLVRSWAARCLAVRIVTQGNRGKRTAGVDGLRALPPAQRLELTRDLRLSPKAYPTRRVWIPKPGTTEKRPLGIPTIRNRAEQTLARLALEPEWEAHFEPNSYGFRPGRSCQDAIEQIFLSLNRKPKYVLDADIAKCFDHIQHEALLKKLHTYPALCRVIRAWLKAGVMEAGQWSPTLEGTPQGGAVSPLLANIALHGLEQVVTTAFRRHHTPNVIRYADDFVILHPDLAAIEKIRTILTAWLAEMGLELKPSKTRITHTLEDYQGHLGFDFLGFHVRQFRKGQTHTGRSTHGEPLDFKTLIQPSPEAIRRHYEALREIIDRNLMAPQAELIAQLNPVIRGWANYYSAVVSKRTFSKLDNRLYFKLRHWGYRRHPRHSHRWIVRKYWRLERGRWTFGTPDVKKILFTHSRVPIQRHIKVRGTKSPFDGDWLYWATRLGRQPDIPPRQAKLLRRQRGRCAWCQLFFKQGDRMEIDHIIPKSQGGQEGYANWQLLHGHCHDQKTVGDQFRRSAGDKGHPVEEPDEAKASCPVLKTSRKGDQPA